MAALGALEDFSGVGLSPLGALLGFSFSFVLSAAEGAITDLVALVATLATLAFEVAVETTGIVLEGAKGGAVEAAVVAGVADGKVGVANDATVAAAAAVAGGFRIA